MLQNMPFRGQIVMTDYTRDNYECVLVRAGVLVHSSQTINTPSALIMIAMGNQISGCHLRCGPAFRFLVGKQPRQHEVYIWCLSIISCGKGSIIFARCVPTSGEMWNLKASTVEHYRGCLIVLDLRASLRHRCWTLFSFAHGLCVQMNEFVAEIRFTKHRC